MRGGLGAGVPGVAPAEHGHQEQRGPEQEVGGGQRPQQPHPAHTLLCALQLELHIRVDIVTL